jgi:hypothetical protein
MEVMSVEQIATDLKGPDENLPPGYASVTPHRIEAVPRDQYNQDGGNRHRDP